MQNTGVVNNIAMAIIMAFMSYFLPLPVFLVTLQPPLPRLARVPLPLPSLFGVPFAMLISSVEVKLPDAGTFGLLFCSPLLRLFVSVTRYQGALPSALGLNNNEG